MFFKPNFKRVHNKLPPKYDLFHSKWIQLQSSWSGLPSILTVPEVFSGAVELGLIKNMGRYPYPIFVF